MYRLVAGVLPVIIVGCAFAPAAQSATTHDEYVAQVNPICKDGARQAKRISRRIDTGDPRTDFLRRVGAFTKLFAKGTRRIAEVDPAPGYEGRVNEWVDGLRQQKRLLGKVLRAGKAGRASAYFRRVKKLSRVERRNGQKAKDLGLKACAG